MGFLKDLEDRLIVLRDNSTLKQVVHDRIDAINADSKNNYPLLLWRCNTGANTDIRKKNQTVTKSFTFYLSDIWFQGDKRTLGEKIDELEGLLIKIINSIPDQSPRTNTFEVLPSADTVYGWEQHNDNLVVVQATVELSYFNCVERIDI